MENLSKKQIIVIAIIAVIIVIVVGYYFINNFQQINYEILDEAEISEENDTQTNTIIEEISQKIIVHIAGAVRQEGIVTLEEGQRIVDAINEAGGLTEKADLTNVNLAYILSDGQKIYIPTVGEEAKISTENGEKIIVDTKEENTKNNLLININTATIAELLELPRSRKLNSTKNNRI